jgi:hypothetical protein
MKQNSHLYFLLSGLIFILTSCVRTEADLFDESSALRLNHAIADSKELLLSANNGWVMEYFPTNDSAGINFLIKFNQDEMAVVAAKNKYTPNYTESKGAWNVIGDTGPVLTFDTYIDVLHLFSDPNKGPEENLGTGYGGDYEFIIMNISDNLIQLKSKKRGITILMHRLDENQDWQDYFKLLDEMDATIFAHSDIPRLLMCYEGDSLYTLTNGASHIFTMQSADSIAEPENMPFIITGYGIRFSRIFKVQEEELQVFLLNDTKDALISENNSSVKLIPEPISNFIHKNPSKYFGIKDSLGGVFNSIFAKMAEELTSTYSGRRDLVSIGFTKRENNFYFLLKTAANEAAFHIPYSIGNNAITIEPFDGNNMSREDMDNNARLFYAAIPSVKEILNAIQGTYDLTSKEAFSLNTIKYTKKENTADYLIVKR